MTRDMPGPPAGPVGAGEPSGTVEAPPPTAGTEANEPPREAGKSRKLLYVTLPGCWGALIAGCLSFTPSLLPRGGIIQGVIWGITAAIGYGLGVLAAWIWRAFADRDPRKPRRRSWPVFFIGAAVLVVVSFGLGQYWQYEIRKLMDVTDYNIALVVASPFIAALVFCLILLIGRGLRGLYRWVAHLLGRWIGRRAAHAIGWIGVAGLAYVVVSGLLLQGFLNVMNEAYSVRDTKTAEGVHQPTTSLRSGGPGSLIPWDTLGWQGRNFTGKGPSVNDIEKATGQPAMAPIRVYAGLASAADAEARADLAVRDLERAGGFQRKNLLVVTTTGSGWVDPALSDSFEYLSGGARSSTRSTVPGRNYPRASAPGCTSPARASGRSAVRPPSAANRAWPTSLTARCSPGRPTSTRCSGSSATTATPAAPRFSPSTTTAGSCGSRMMRPRTYRRMASPGRAAGSCT